MDVTTAEISELTDSEATEIKNFLDNGGQPIAAEIYIDTKNENDPTQLNQNLVVDDSFTDFPRLNCVLQKMQNTTVMEDFINDFANDDFDVATTLSCKYLYYEPGTDKETLEPNGTPINLPEGHHFGIHQGNTTIYSEAVYNKKQAEYDLSSSINIAYILIHELFHAYMLQQSTNENNNYPPSDSFTYLFDNFLVVKFGDNHNQMAHVFRRKATRALYNFGLSGQQFDSLPLQDKLILFKKLSDFTWKGLKETTAWSNLSQAQKTEINAATNEFAYRGNINQNLLTECDD